MTKILVLIFMLYMHIIDDYTIQGILADMKQREWWIKNAHINDDSQYRNDYLMALYEHAFCWSVSVSIPILIYDWAYGLSINRVQFLIAFICMWIVHAYVDNLKANKFLINLIQDQLIHFGQIIVYWIIFILK